MPKRTTKPTEVPAPKTKVLGGTSLLADIREVIEAARDQTARAVNSGLVVMYWQIGKRIREDVLQNERAEYGKEIVSALSTQLTEEFGRGFGRRSLFRMMQFSEYFPDGQIVSALSAQLSWSHFIELISLDDRLKREFYAEMCRVERWSVRTLRHKIGHLLYERTAVAKKPAELIEQDITTLRDEDRLTPDMVFRDPYFLDFLGLSDQHAEKDVEQAILRELESFILEMGTDFAFVTRQKRITVDSEDYYVDLVFYHRRLRCLVAIDLKLGKFQAADKGQMELYLRWLEEHETQPGEDAPLGLILCADKSTEHVELLRLEETGIRVAQYLTELPPRELLERKLHESIRLARERLARLEGGTFRPEGARMIESQFDSADIRSHLVDALRLDLVGPGMELGTAEEILNQPPSRWYLTGFLVPVEADESQKSDADADDELEEGADTAGTDDATEPEKPAARRAYMPSSVGVSLLVDKDARKLDVIVRWGDYFYQEPDPDDPTYLWKRSPREETVTIELPKQDFHRDEIEVNNSKGLFVAVSARAVRGADVEGGIPAGTRSVSLFLVNRRTPSPDEVRDEAFAFQVALEVTSDNPFVPRPDLRSLESEEWDMRVADLQYRDAFEFAVGHSISTEAVVNDGQCSLVKTSWIPEAEVERVAPAAIKDVQLSMGTLSLLRDGADARKQLMPFVEQYREWIKDQRNKAPASPERRQIMSAELLNRAEVAANRIEQGIELLSDETALDAFRIANRAMNAQAARRLGIPNPEWRPFQLAFLLMNLKGIVEPTDDDRNVVDLLFFPTGGGKTEAYLGLAAFTLVLRRLRNPGISSAGLTVLMRYTLRLLTLDQLGRAAALICALELERQKDAEKLGDWPFEIALWVGRAATPNHMGHKGDNQRETARAKTIAFKSDDRKPSPIPLEECPWCGTKFKSTSFSLKPNPNNPTDLRINCVNRDCDFSRGNPLPIVAVDEPIYRRLPCFMIATVDKFAAMPWTGEVGGFFGRVERYDKDGFYGPCTPAVGHPIPEGKLPPPELIIQDELHLISGPLGTVAGLYETALDELSTQEVNGKRVRPKIIASTATVRRADSQIRALFNRRQVDIFPPPGPDVRDSFFAKTLSSGESNARQYIGVAAQGRSPKRILLRTALALMAAAQKQYGEHKKSDDNPVDPYMTLLGYFNSLRELGGTRRIAEDELRNSLAGYGSRKRVGEETGSFDNRWISYEVLELTSRVSTDKVAEAKRRLSKPFSDKERVDVALATNMISVGLDITRLGLMLVFGQPKTSSEYIQATSRVGRDHRRPGLVVTVLNLNRPRDRSHYERFAAFHESFYRTVEATSVTPFSPRALDRALAGTLVALARHGHAPLTPPLAAQGILTERPRLDYVVDAIANRAHNHEELEPERADELRAHVRQRCLDLLDEWSKIAEEYRTSGTQLQYQREVGAAKQLLYEFLSPDLKTVHPRHMKFRANRSMRDVEPEVNLWMRQLSGAEVEDFDDE